AGWIEVGGAYAMFDTPDSPCTQTFGFGLFSAPDAEQLATIEGFFEQRGAPVFHEVSPLADKSVLPLLSGRGYWPIELSSVMYLPVEARQIVAAELGVRVADELDVWSRTLAAGWEMPGLGELMRVSAGREGFVP